MSADPTFIGGPWDGGKVAMPLWALDQIEYAADVQIDQVVYICYDLDEDTKNYIYKGQKILPRKQVEE